MDICRQSKDYKSLLKYTIKTDTCFIFLCDKLNIATHLDGAISYENKTYPNFIPHYNFCRYTNKQHCFPIKQYNYILDWPKNDN